jgi:hypothetical protein
LCVLLSLVKLGHFDHPDAGDRTRQHQVAGGALLLLLALNSVVKMLGSYARLHYRLLKPEQDVV